MKKTLCYFVSLTCFLLVVSQPVHSQCDTMRSALAGGSVYMLDCPNGEGGGNVAASVGPDGILLVDNMFKTSTPMVLDALKSLSSANVRMVINSHFHRDHIEGNSVVSGSSIIVAHENLLKRLTTKGTWATSEALPHITLSDKVTIRFNGEEIQVFHLPNGHSDTDVYTYFTKSKVIHMGDTFFNGMFPAVYTEGGGNIEQLIINLEKVLSMLPDDAKVIPGHGPLASKADFKNYVTMLKETTSVVSAGIKSGKTLQQLIDAKSIDKYSSLGSGGAQTTEQYLGMLYKLLSK